MKLSCYVSFMKVLKSREELSAALTEVSFDASFAVVFFAGGLDVATIVAIRNAKRLCDEVVVCPLFSQPLTPAHLQLLERAEASFVWQFEQSLEPCNVVVEGLNLPSTFMMQALLTVMPLLVTAPESHVHLISALKKMQKTFGSFFTLEVKKTPYDLLSLAQRNLRDCLKTVFLEIKGGENDVELLSKLSIKCLNSAGFEVKEVSFMDGDTLQNNHKIVSASSLIYIEALHGGQLCRDIFSLFEE